MDLLNSRCLRVVQSRIRRVWDGFSERRRFRLGERRKTPRRKQPRGRFLHACALGTARGSAGSATGRLPPTVALESPLARRGRLAPARIRGSRLAARARTRPLAWRGGSASPGVGLAGGASITVMAPPGGNGSMLFAVESPDRSWQLSGLQGLADYGGRGKGKKEMG
jgi:hypothetical protein